VVPALHIGLAGDAPQTPPSRFTLAGIDRVDIARGTARGVQRSKQDGADVLSLAIADGRMSSQHARISRLGNGWILEDLSSKNGTWVGSQRVSRHTLADGDAFVVGHTVIVFRDHGGETADAEQPSNPPAFGLATMSPRIAELFGALVQGAKSNIPIEILGETGTGKELVAQAVHQLSGRPGKFVAVNCGALAANLTEAELFGHKKGAFTGAGEERSGLIRSAHGGTLFLDEIGELPQAAQAALLRVLQEREVLPIGADQPVKVDLRVVTATHRNLDADVEANRFRADLRARLLGLAIELPPLRARLEDLGQLVAILLKRHAPDREIAFSADAVAALYTSAWPLNVRGLEKALAAAVVIARERIELQHLPEWVRQPLAPAAPKSATGPEEPLRDLLVSALERNDGNIAVVARELGKDPTQIRRWIKRFGLSRSDED
jgi:DNA-binding NtrC family response regulator